MILGISLSSISWGSENDSNSPLKNGWVLDGASSSLTFQTIKNESILEIHSFESDEGSLDSVDTKVDLTNVRLRFLLFETYKYPDAVVTAKIDPAALASLSQRDCLEIPLAFELDLHGVKQPFKLQTVVTKLEGNWVSVASVEPLPIETTLFNLDAGLKKLEDSANLSIVPVAAVSFNLVFKI